jgi:ComF family protein
LNITRFSYRLTSSFIDFIYPPECISCHAPLDDGGQKVCETCWRAIRRITPDLPLYTETKARLREEGCVSDLISCFLFEKEGPLQHIIHALKYQKYKSLGFELGGRLGRLIAGGQKDIDIIVPVPLHKIKQRERGYNQAELIAKGISAAFGRPIVGEAVRRTRNTQTQTKLDIEGRRKNVEGAFAPNPAARDLIRGKTCLLVDDVITTGATTSSCAKELLAAGAACVIAGSAALAA